MYSFLREVIFWCPIFLDLGASWAKFCKKSKVPKSTTINPRVFQSMFLIVFWKKWCAALSSVVVHGAPEGQNNADVVEATVQDSRGLPLRVQILVQLLSNCAAVAQAAASLVLLHVCIIWLAFFLDSSTNYTVVFSEMFVETFKRRRVLRTHPRRFRRGGLSFVE